MIFHTDYSNNPIDPEIDPPGTHRHKCESCGVVWRHGNEMADSLQAHTCPGCNGVLAGRWYHYKGSCRVTPIEALPKIPFGGSDYTFYLP